MMTEIDRTSYDVRSISSSKIYFNFFFTFMNRRNRYETCCQDRSSSIGLRYTAICQSPVPHEVILTIETTSV